MLKKLVKYFFRTAGYELSRVDNDILVPGSDKRPVGKMDFLLEDLKRRGLNCTTVIDVGANWSGWSRMAKQIFPSAAFFLIEPQVEMQLKLEEFCREYNDSDYILAGAGKRSGSSTLTVWDDFAGSSFLPKPDQILKSTNKQREIEIVTIDDLITSGKVLVPELIKLDIQGFELEALKGATNTFGLTEVYIVESSFFQYPDLPELPCFIDVANFMFERGYVVYDFAGFGRRPFDGALGQCDICFVKQNGFLRQSNLWA